MTKECEKNELKLRKSPLYYVCFRKSDRWWGMFLKKDFGHCFVLINDGINWIEVCPRLRKAFISIIPVAANEDILKMYHKEIPEFVAIEMEFSEKFQPKVLFYAPTCVGFVKYVLGIRMWACTPYRLFRKLLKLNAPVVSGSPMQLKDIKKIKNIRRAI
jgi:hypothetical protein